MHTLIVSGGTLEETFALEYIRTHIFERVIAADRGLEFIYMNNLPVTDIVGDFDSLNPDILEKYKDSGVNFRKYPSEKDATDTQIAMQLAISSQSSKITILGATGTRIDHLLANIQLLNIPLRKGIPSCILDSRNKIQLIDKNTMIEKEKCFGTFISFLPLTTDVKGLTLRGFKYPLEQHLLTSEDSLGISNEVIEKTGSVEFESGILIMIQSRD